MSDEEGPPAKKARESPGYIPTSLSSLPQPQCPYGAMCYRKNPAHFMEYSHPPKEKNSDGAGPSNSVPRTVGIDTSKLPPCQYGANCYRKNLLHFAEYSHPFTTSGENSIPEDGSGSDTDVLEDEENKGTNKRKKSNSLSKGPSLVKSYSKMTEEERRDLIHKAFEAKEALQKELDKTKNILALKDLELKNLQHRVTNGLLLMDGEKEALEGKKVQYFPLLAERRYREGSADQVHFRLAESQFYRLISGQNTGYVVTKVEYVVNPKLHRNFRQAQCDMRFERGEELSLPVLAFHGTKQENIKPICENGFLVPGEQGFTHRTDTGYYGKGVYFSEYPAYSISYIQGAQKLLLCQVLPGKVFQCTTLIHGHPLKSGYDSHTSPCKKELIIFNSHHILPCYIVHYSQAGTEFKYKKKPEEKEGNWVSGDQLNKLYWKAVKAKANPMLFSGLTFKFLGKLCDQISALNKLVEKHGAYKGTSTYGQQVCVCTRQTFEKQPKKMIESMQMNYGFQTYAVHEQFIYDSIIKKSKQDFEDYCFD